MQPPFYRYVLAHGAGISEGAGVIVALWLLVAGLQSHGALTARPGVVIWIALAAVPVAAIGWIIGLILLWGMVLGPVAARIQGWPFVVGDRVWILSGSRRNTLGTVYEVWKERGQVRVDLGSEAKENVGDVFCAVALCRARSDEQTGQRM